MEIKDLQAKLRQATDSVERKKIACQIQAVLNAKRCAAAGAASIEAEAEYKKLVAQRNAVNQAVANFINGQVVALANKYGLSTFNRGGKTWITF